MTIAEMNELTGIDYIAEIWGADTADRIVKAIGNYPILHPMGMGDFLSHCTACGGNWGGMLLTGIKELYPEVWDAIPDDMGVFAFAGLCETIRLCGVLPEEELPR